MREIKFRAWSEKENRYYPEVGTHRSIMMWHDGYNKNDLGALTVSEGFKNYTIEQFTGLHDKNGKEIYEGDVLRLNYANTPIEGVVRWFQGNRHPEDGCYGVEFLGWVLTKYNDRDPVNECYHMSIESVREVIGNIHENPELMEEI